MFLESQANDTGVNNGWYTHPLHRIQNVAVESYTLVLGPTWRRWAVTASILFVAHEVAGRDSEVMIWGQDTP
jgi:hypothetical protein